MMLVAICLAIPQRMHLSGNVMEIWRLKDNGVTTLTFLGHVMSSVTFDSRGSTSYGWSIVTMRLSSTVMEIWPLKFFQEGSSRNRGLSLVGWLVLNITLISCTPFRYVGNVAREE